MTRYNYSYLLEYIPVRYTGLSSKQLQDRKAVYDFKDGSAPAAVKRGLLSKIRNIISKNPSQWVVCFLPASTKTKTYNRFSSVAIHFSREAGCDVYIDAIVNAMDSTSLLQSGGSTNPTQCFKIKSDYIKGKKVILIGDVITRGHTFDDTADKLIQMGAVGVEGLFVAKTVRPNLPQVSSNSHTYCKEYDIFDEMNYDKMKAMAREVAYQDETMDELTVDRKDYLD